MPHDKRIEFVFPAHQLGICRTEAAKKASAPHCVLLELW
jgi:hypothetical protein